MNFWVTGPRDDLRERTPLIVSFCKYGADYPNTIPNRVQIADTMNARVLVARHFSDAQACFRDADVYQSFDFESVSPERTSVFSGSRILKTCCL